MSQKINFFYFVLVFMISHFFECDIFAETPPSSERLVVWDCPPAKEFIVVFRFLNEKSKMKMTEEQRKDLAHEVAKSCHRAGWRFIQTIKVLERADIDSRHALELALEMSRSTDERVKAFLTIFKISHGSNYLNLDLFQSLQTARRLSIDFEDMPDWLERDFKKLALFCIKPKQLDLPRSQCANWAANLILLVLKKDKNLEELKIGVAEPFLSGFEFLTEDDGPNLITLDALKLLNRLIAISPHAVESFQEAYEFAIDAKGLKLNRDRALAFAEELAQYTFKNQEPAERRPKISKSIESSDASPLPKAREPESFE